MRALMIGLTTILLLAGCGQKGPLVLPQDAAGNGQATQTDSEN